MIINSNSLKENGEDGPLGVTITVDDDTSREDFAKFRKGFSELTLIDLVGKTTDEDVGNVFVARCSLRRGLSTFGLDR